MEIDEEKLLPVLESLTSDLNVPFLERRGREKLHRQSPIEELRDVVNLLNQRERELTAAVDIAKMLIVKSKRHISALEESKEQTELVTRVLRAHQQEIQILREALKSAETKREQTENMLAEAEENLERASQETVCYSERLEKMKKEGGLKNAENAIAEMKETMAEQYQAFDRTRRVLERENEKFRASMSSLERDNLSLVEETRRLNSDLSQTAKKLQESTRLAHSLQSRIRELEEELKCRNIDLSVAQRKVEKLTEELSAGSPSPNGDWRKSRTSVKESMVFAVQDCESEESEEESLGAKIQTTDELPQAVPSLAVDCWKRMLALDRLPSIAIPSPRREQDQSRKDPSEEYFILASQAVKLNSPYMDTICTVSTKELYEKAVKNVIPFHKWHVWIESQLTNAYLESVYVAAGRKTGAKTGRRKVSPI